MPPANVSPDLLGRGRGGGDCTSAGVLGADGQTTKVLMVLSSIGWLACCVPVGMVRKLDESQTLLA